MSSAARIRFATPEERNRYFDELLEAERTLDAIAARGTILKQTTEPAWMRAMSPDERVHNRKIEE